MSFWYCVAEVSLPLNDVPDNINQRESNLEGLKMQLMWLWKTLGHMSHMGGNKVLLKQAQSLPNPGLDHHVLHLDLGICGVSAHSYCCSQALLKMMSTAYIIIGTSVGWGSDPDITTIIIIIILKNKQLSLCLYWINLKVHFIGCFLNLHSHF